MGTSSTFLKDPDATLDYGRDWTDWLEAGDTIASSTWIVPAGLTKVTDEHDTTTATVKLSGGTDGVDYTCVNRITTVAGHVDDRSIRLMVRQR